MKKICAFILIFSLVFAFCSCGKALKIDVHMFSDIEECNNIVSSKENEAQINYLSAEEDKNSKDLKYEEFFGCKYICEELSFEIFAYSFSNSELAMDYLSCGIDPKVTSIFIQSQIPEIAELTIFFSNLG